MLGKQSLTDNNRKMIKTEIKKQEIANLLQER